MAVSDDFTVLHWMGQKRWDAGQTYRMLVQREGPQEEPSFMGGAR